MPLDITSANAIAVLTVDQIFPTGIYLQQFSADTAITQETIEYSESRMGVDGYMASGYTPAIKVVTINLEASSPSTDAMIEIGQRMTSQRTIYRCNLTINLRSINHTFRWRNGVLTSGTPLPSLSRILDPTEWTFSFQDFDPGR